MSAIEFISEDKNTVILTVSCAVPTPNASDEYIRIEGLDEKAVYIDIGSGKQYGGDLLMNLGWHFVSKTDNQSVIIAFTKNN